MAFAPCSVNQRFPSGPGAIPVGSEAAVAIETSVTRSTGTLAILLAPFSVSQTLPSDPVVIANGPAAAVGSANRVIAPAGVIWPTLLLPPAVNQRLPSAAAVI